MTAYAQRKEDQKLAATQAEAGQPLQTPKTNERQSHLETNRKEHISPAQILNLVKQAKKATGDDLPIIPLPDGSKVQIVTLDSGKFFLCHTKQDGSYPVEYNFNKSGIYNDARTSPLDYSTSGTYRDASQELLRTIKKYLSNSEKH